MARGNSTGSLKKLCILTLGGGIAFWAASFITSLLPISAQYRASFSIRSWDAQTVWVGSAFMGLMMACAASFFLLRSIKKNPAGNPIEESIKLSSIALAAAVILVDVPQTFLLPGVSEALRTFILGASFNVVRFLLLGFAIGYLDKKIFGPARAQNVGLV